jgi:hypothetical protein
MDIVHAGQMEWGENLAAQRAGRMAHKRLYEGKEHSPDNYLLVLANEGSDYYSPRHRHAWDQVRWCLEGSVPIGRDLRIDAGEIGYFPEGVHYGPQEGGPDRLVLLLQIGGASGLGYLSPDQLRAGRERLLEQGAFEQGVFRRTTGTGKKNQDAYEAIWQAVTGRTLEYPKPQYKAPIIMRPDGFTWRSLDEASGVRGKCLGEFPERGLTLELLALDDGASHEIAAGHALRLIFVREGQGLCNDQPFFAHSAVRLEPHETLRLDASRGTVLLLMHVLAVGYPGRSRRPG